MSTLRNRALICVVASLLGARVEAPTDNPPQSSATVTVQAPDDGYGRPVQDRDAWEPLGRDLLWGFRNMYQPCVIERPGKAYPYEMWFFGWAAEDTNPGQSGCDAVYHARSKNLLDWEIYCGERGWDAEMRAEQWAPVLTASDRHYDEWHNGDPSVVWKDGRYYMAYSATSKPLYKKTKDHLEGMLLCIMGAVSDDGIHWTKTDQPLLIESREAREADHDTALPCDFHRPSLMWDEDRWKLWFDYWNPPHGVCMGYAENTGAFGAADAFRIRHDLREALILNWPNPSVVKAGDRYYSFADPSGYPPTDASSAQARGWTTRALCEAVSEDGWNWRIVGYIKPDADAAACHVPQALATKQGDADWLYVFYATQRGGQPVYDYRYDRIRAIRRRL